MNFGEALQALKQSKTVARQGWNGKNMYLFLQVGSTPAPLEDPPMANPLLGGVPIGLFDMAPPDTVRRMPCIVMKAADGSHVTGWLASQTDMLAEDWMIV